MEDFIFDNMGKFIIISFVIIIGIVVFGLYYQITHCVSGHESEPRYHSPSYVMMGKIIMPIGGGTYSEFICDKWK